MDFNFIKKLKFEQCKSLVYALNEDGYLIDAGNGRVAYNTFFSPREINALFNQTASLILLNIDGEKDLNEVFHYTYNTFFNEQISLEQYLYDFMDTINKLEHLGIIISLVELNRAESIKKHLRKTINMKRNFLNDIFYLD